MNLVTLSVTHAIWLFSPYPIICCNPSNSLSGRARGAPALKCWWTFEWRGALLARSFISFQQLTLCSQGERQIQSDLLMVGRMETILNTGYGCSWNDLSSLLGFSQSLSPFLCGTTTNNQHTNMVTHTEGLRLTPFVLLDARWTHWVSGLATSWIWFGSILYIYIYILKNSFFEGSWFCRIILVREQCSLQGPRQPYSRSIPGY